MAELNEKARKLIEEPNFGYLATVMEDGSPQVSPVWVDLENGYVSFNTARGRVKERNLRRDPRVTLTVVNHENPYEYAVIRGRLAGDTHDGADENIDKLAKKYLGKDEYPFRRPGEQRVIFRIEPERVNLHGG